MPYKNKADRKSPKNPPVGSEGHRKRMERQRARRAFDKKYGKAARAGKDLHHKKSLESGGSNSDGVVTLSRNTNRAAGGAMNKGKKRSKKA